MAMGKIEVRRMNDLESQLEKAVDLLNRYQNKEAVDFIPYEWETVEFSKEVEDFLNEVEADNG